MVRIINEQPNTIGIALSGGGIKGMCHAGVLKALEEKGIIPDVISGVSAGSVVGAFYADGYSPDDIATLFQDISFRQMTRIRMRSGGLFKIDAFERFLADNLRAKTFEELKIPLYVVATNLDEGCSTTFTQGDLIAPVVASCSVPILFSPRLINGMHYVDGGVLKNFPVSTIRNECDYLIGINASPMVVDNFKPSILNVATRTYHFMFKSNILVDKELCDLVIEPLDMVNYETFSVEKGREIYELGYETAHAILDKLGRHNVHVTA